MYYAYMLKSKKAPGVHRINNAINAKKIKLSVTSYQHKPIMYHSLNVLLQLD